MPTPTAILAGLRLAAHDAIAVAIAWHVLALLASLALLRGYFPSRRRAGVLLAMPVASASVVALAHAEPFNALLLGALALMLIAVALRLEGQPVHLAEGAPRVAGALMVAFGLAYPHFLDSFPAPIYLVAAPVGVIPCPTLALVIGGALLLDGLGSRAWSLALAVVGLFYGVFGAARLGVVMDVALIAGAATLLVGQVRAPSPAKPINIAAR
jgi:hypothetical protein